MCCLTNAEADGATGIMMTRLDTSFVRAHRDGCIIDAAA
jgi:hypothetical protein